MFTLKTWRSLHRRVFCIKSYDDRVQCSQKAAWRLHSRLNTSYEPAEDAHYATDTCIIKPLPLCSLGSGTNLIIRLSSTPGTRWYTKLGSLTAASWWSERKIYTNKKDKPIILSLEFTLFTLEILSLCFI